jgi:hypothetical protein
MMDVCVRYLINCNAYPTLYYLTNLVFLIFSFIEILPRAALNEVFGSKVDNGFNSVELHWALRFQIHVKCRGVLSSKGYLLSVHRLSGKRADGVASLTELPKP